jgi:6-pyruvoyltetrahydropterin/6-carboxytetrahydropterin synthase
MFTLQKTVTISSSHHLNLDYPSPCSNQHGHNWKITVVVKGDELNKNRMLADFKAVKELIMILDHTSLNKIIEQPTAEVIALWVYDKVNAYLYSHWSGDNESPYCEKVIVEESEGSVVTYE